MQLSSKIFHVYLEIGKKHTFAGAVEWPGWCRKGSNEASALQALYDYAPRYASILQAAQIEFQPPDDPFAFTVVEQMEGNATTDFGAPNMSPSCDYKEVGEPEFLRFQALLMAYWQAFDVAVMTANGRELSKGARGGGRDLAGIIEHVLGSDASDLARVAWKFQAHGTGSDGADLGRSRQAVLDALARASLGKMPELGPRGGEIWTARRFMRYVSWHVLDHAWEIEDRIG